VENSPVMIFRWGAGSGWPVDWVSENVSQLGYSAEEIRSGKARYSDIIHPADLYRVETEIEEYISLGVDRYQQEYRVVTRDRRVRWVNDLTTVTRDERGQPLYFDSVVVDITERKQAELALQQRVLEMEAVERVSSALRAADQLSSMLPLLLDEMLGILDTSAGAIALYDPSGSAIQHLETRGWVNEVRDVFNETDVFLAPAKAHRAPVHRMDWTLDPGMPIQYRSRFPAGWGGAILPLQAVDLVLGVALISVQQPRTLTSDELRLLETLSAVAGNAIHRAQSFEQTQHNLKRIAALHEIDNIIRSNLDVRLTLGVILDLVLEQMEADAADILLSEGDATVLVQAAGRGFRFWSGEPIQVYLGDDLAGQAALEMRRVEYGPEDFRVLSSTRAGLFGLEGFRRALSAPLTSKGHLVGVLDVYRRRDKVFNADQIDFLTVLAGQTAVAVESLRLLEDLQRSNLELVVAYNDTIEGWSRAMDLRDRETEGHTQRVTEMTLKLARHMGLSDAELAHVRRGALLHDIGKIGVPDNILNKPGALTDEEWEVMRKHPQFAYDLISPIAYLIPALDIPYCHHEKWDGSGYPRGLKGKQIPLAARLFAVVDVFDALTSDRPYRPAWSKRKALAYIREHAGSHFDPACVEAFFDLFGKDNH
jgi:PAS domain S-box-containing protein